MSDCCSTDSAKPEPKARCPANGTLYGRVPVRTVLHHIKAPWHYQVLERQYYFCEDPGCDVVYFGLSGATIDRSALRTRVGVKTRAPAATVCYCFGITRGDITADPATRDFVIAQTQAHNCACEVRNPSGRCCLRDFPRSQA